MCTNFYCSLLLELETGVRSKVEVHELKSNRVCEWINDKRVHGKQA